ncbi:MAG: hypothetical protein BJ554DRAFT_6274, partial [Olpidium bornovanus]
KDAGLRSNVVHQAGRRQQRVRRFRRRRPPDLFRGNPAARLARRAPVLRVLVAAPAAQENHPRNGELRVPDQAGGSEHGHEVHRNAAPGAPELSAAFRRRVRNGRNLRRSGRGRGGAGPPAGEQEDHNQEHLQGGVGGDRGPDGLAVGSDQADPAVRQRQHVRPEWGRAAPRLHVLLQLLRGGPVVVVVVVAKRAIRRAARRKRRPVHDRVPLRPVQRGVRSQGKQQLAAPAVRHPDTAAALRGGGRK